MMTKSIQRPMVLCWFAFLSFFFIISTPYGSSPPFHAETFTVTIREPAGIARRSEPVKVSLPFAEGQLTDENTVVILNGEGEIIYTQYEVPARWNDGSIRWVLAHVLVDIPAHGELTFTVEKGHARQNDGVVDLAALKGGKISVDTGVMKIRLGTDYRDGFEVNDTGGSALLANRPGLVVYAPTGGEYRAKEADTIEVESNGPMYCSIFLVGPMASKEGNYDHIFRWETRLHFWKGLSRVLAEHTVAAMDNADEGVTNVDGIVVDLKGRDCFNTFTIAGQDLQQHEGGLSAGERIRIEQTCAYWHECVSMREGLDYVVLDNDMKYALTCSTGQVPGEGEKSAGWLWSAGSQGAMGVAVRDFWEEGPKALSVGQDGSLAVECYAYWAAKPGEQRPKREPTPNYFEHPRLDEWIGESESAKAVIRRWLDDTGYEGPVRRGPFRFGKGRAKTTDVLYVFGKANDKAQQIDVLKAYRHYLIPVVDPVYLASTKALPFVWTAASESSLPVFEKGLLAAFSNWKKYATRYGFLHYGDDQCHWGYNRTVPATTDDQEYDTTQCLTMQFGRTGMEDYLRQANICARHFMDVDQVHDDGQLHYHGYNKGGDYHEESKNCDMKGHPYIGGIVNHYMLTGDRRSLRGVNLLANALRDYGGRRRYIMKNNERGLVRGGICLAAIYDLTHDPAHLRPLKEVIDAMNDLTGNVTTELRGREPFHIWWIHHNEFAHHVREFLVRAYLATGNPKTLATLQLSCDQYLHDLWDSEKRAWRCFGHDFNMQYEHAVPREPLGGPSYSELAASHYGMGFIYLAGAMNDDFYLSPFLESLDTLGADFANKYGNRAFTECQLWAIPMISMLPKTWRQDKDRIVRREVLRSSLTKKDDLDGWSPEGTVFGEAHGELLWQDSPFGKVLRTYNNSFVHYRAPKDILEKPGTMCFWVRKDEAKWVSKPWPWYGELRGLLHIGSDQRETNALDLMMLKDKLWTRLYDNRGWEMAAIESESPAWDQQEWHHIAVVWNRFDFTVYINGKQAGHDDRFSLPNGGQTHIWLGWRPSNRYGQADYYDLRVFRAALPADTMQAIYQSSRP